MAGNAVALDKYRSIMHLRYVCLVSAPLLCLQVVYLSQKRPVQVISQPMLTFGLLAPLPARVMLKQRLLRSLWQKGTGRDARSAVGTIYIIWMAMPESCYTFGLIAYFVTYDYQQLYYFYPIGMVASIIVWPTRERFDALVGQLEES